MKKFFLWGIVFFLKGSLCFGDWNACFDEATEKLVFSLGDVDSTKYIEDCKFFRGLRTKCLQNRELLRRISSMKIAQKELIFLSRENVVLKKRSNDNLCELFAWEISTLLGCDSCVVPSFAMEIAGKKVVAQRLEPFSVTKVPMRSLLQKVSLGTYWKAQLQAYLIGVKDLMGKNIGITEAGEIRLFDLESCFCYQNHPCKHSNAFHTGFLMQSFMWPQYYQPLDETSLDSLKSFLELLYLIEERILLYLKHRSFSLDLHGFTYRLNKIRNFNWETGQSFDDFYRFLFPRVALGLPCLNEIIGRSIQKKVDGVEALLFLRKGYKKEKLSSSARKDLKKWIDAYID